MTYVCIRIALTGVQRQRCCPSGGGGVGVNPWELSVRIRSLSPRRNLASEARGGATAVEMAIAAPLLLLILFGLFEIGHAFMTKHLMEDSARAGCRAAMVPRTTNARVMDTIQQSLASKGIRGAATTIRVNGGNTDVSQAKAGDDVRVEITLALSNIWIIPRRYLSGQLIASCNRRRE